MRVAGTDVAVVGGGSIGLATAWRAAAAGMDVVVCDPAPGRGASWAAGGMLAPVTEAHYGEEPLLRLNLASRELWPGFAAELEEESGRAPGYEAAGTVLVARDRDDLDALEAMLAFMLRLGLSAERLRAGDVRELEPTLSPRVRGGVHAPDDHRVDNRALVDALEAAVVRRGGRIVHERVTRIDVADDRVTGVALGDGSRLAAGHVVLAAGAWSGSIEGVEPGSVPVRPVKGQILRLGARPDAVAPTITVRGLDVYMVPRSDGGLVVGATAEERGFDTAVTAGGALHLLREAYELAPGITELELLEVSAGLRPGTPDNAPLIGPGSVDGLVVATGHYRHGLLLTPVTAEAVVHLLDGRAVPDVVAPFAPDRFVGAGR